MNTSTEILNVPHGEDARTHTLQALDTKSDTHEVNTQITSIAEQKVVTHDPHTQDTKTSQIENDVALHGKRSRKAVLSKFEDDFEEEPPKKRGRRRKEEKEKKEEVKAESATEPVSAGLFVLPPFDVSLSYHYQFASMICFPFKISFSYF